MTVDFQFLLERNSITYKEDKNMKRTVHFLPNSLGALLCVSFIIMLVSSFAPTVSTHRSVLQGGLPTPTPCLNKAVCGEWSAVDTSWPIAPIHMHVLPSGKVLTWSRDKEPCPNDPSQFCDTHSYTKVYVWDPNPNANPRFTQVDNTQTNLFCAGHSYLSDGQLLVTGGHFMIDGSGEPHTNVF